jgi:hypothetical protein
VNKYLNDVGNEVINNESNDSENDVQHYEVKGIVSDVVNVVNEETNDGVIDDAIICDLNDDMPIINAIELYSDYIKI